MIVPAPVERKWEDELTVCAEISRPYKKQSFAEDFVVIVARGHFGCVEGTEAEDICSSDSDFDRAVEDDEGSEAWGGVGGWITTTFFGKAVSKPLWLS